MKRDMPGSQGMNPWSWPPANCDYDDPWELAWQSIEAIEMDGDNY